jgi:short-subunit dehydrogenase
MDERFLAGRTALVTGAAGGIGSAASASMTGSDLVMDGGWGAR